MQTFYDDEIDVQFVRGQLKTKKKEQRKIKFFYLEFEFQGTYDIVSGYNINYANTIWDIRRTAKGDEVTLSDFTSIDFGEQDVQPLVIKIGSTQFNDARLSKFNAKQREGVAFITVGLEISKPENDKLLDLFSEETVMVLSKR